MVDFCCQNVSAIAKELSLADHFFFSSRRRHTRFDCDWSSDVCSSDLFGGSAATRGGSHRPGDDQAVGRDVPPPAKRRSEERRVGKECRSGRSLYHQKKNAQQKM